MKKTFPIAEYQHGETYRALRAVDKETSFDKLWRKCREVKAVFSGERRPPKAGEWFLSGAEVEAYYAPNDLTQTHYIAKLVIVKQVIREEIEALV